MRPDLQRAFIEKVTPESYDRFKREMDQWLGMTIQYRVAEMPVFVSTEFRSLLEEAAVEIIRQCSSPEAVARTEATLQDRYRSNRPAFQADQCQSGRFFFVPFHGPSAQHNEPEQPV